MRVSRWHLVYTWVILLVPLAAYNAAYVVHYWPTITSTFSELVQCAARLH